MNTSVIQTNSVFVGRQPIYNQQLDVVAYELLFRDGNQNSANFVDGDYATSKVLINSLVEIGLENLVGNRLAFVNFTRGFLTGEFPLPFDKDQLVMEVLEDIQPDETVVNSLQKLVNDGYRIALDDYVFDEKLLSLVELADFIKVDFSLLNQSSIRHKIEELRDYPLKLLAEKIETYDEFEFAKELGFDLFQGYFLSRPQIIEEQTIPNNRLAILNLIGKLQNPNIGMEEIEELVAQDVSLSYKLLRYINSSAIGLRRKVSSIRQAVVLLGIHQLRTMITLIMLTGMDDKPLALIETAMLRAKMCEELALGLGREDQDTFFTVGLFSALDALMDCSMATILDRLPLSDDINGALLNYEGAMGAALSCTIAYERNEWDNVTCLYLDPTQMQQAFLNATAWLGEAEGFLTSPVTANA